MGWFTNRRWIVVAVFATGIGSMGVEFSLVRMLGNIYGTSDVVWAAVIAMVLMFMAVGYTVGGRLADRQPHTVLFYRLIVVAGVSIAIIPVVGHVVLYQGGLAVAQLNISMIVLSVISTILVLALPLVLLGTIVPFALRLSVISVEDSGRTAGILYGVSTLGGLLGTFGSVLWLIPWIGSFYTFLVIATGVIVVGLVGVGAFDRFRFLRIEMASAAILVIIWVFARPGVVRPAPRGFTLLYERETAYNFVQVLEQPDGQRLLLLNEGVAVHSVYNPHQEITYTGATWDYFLVGPYFNAPPFDPGRVKRVAIIGLAGGTIARQYTGIYGPIPIDGVEIDPGIVEVGRDYFGMNQPNLNVIVGDGRVELRKMAFDYSVIGIDAYRVPYVPWNLITVEYFEEVKAHLSEDGVLMLNVGRTPINRSLVDAVTATLQQVFPSVYVIDVPASFNSIVVATKQRTAADNLIRNYEHLTQSGANIALPFMVDQANNRLQPLGDDGIVMTDDKAPVEWLVHAIVLDFVLNGNMSGVGGIR